jgi:ATP-dependent helicase/DNAse subunit B
MPVEVNPDKTTLDEIPKTTEKFAYKAKGIFNGELFHQLDRSDSNRFYNFFVTKKGDQYGKNNISGALEPADFEKVLKFAEKKIIESSGQILSGEIDVRPYRLSGKSPCSYCKYLSVCRFDWQINDYNPLISLGKKRVLEMMEVVDG